MSRLSIAWIFAAITPWVAAAAEAEVGSRACAGCHPAIYRSYMQTGMARASGRIQTGPIIERFSAAAFEDDRTGASYRITPAKNSFRLRFSRSERGVKGVLDLLWFIGSGNTGRSYAFLVDGFLFQAPASYYSSPGRWGLSPGFAGKTQIDVARPIEPACLHCHSSRVQHIRGTGNRYLDPPFLEDGISCERCHGPGAAHVEAMRSGSISQPLRIVNPAKLDPARRDSVCLQCHLTGAARVPRLSRGPTTFQPGDLLSDHVAVFVVDGGDGERAATDHAEQLANSRCRKVAGEKIWCGTCHDPHSQPPREQRAAFYRKPCLGCHDETACAAPLQQRALSADDCASCHMTRARSREGEHVVYTDHTIARKPAAPKPRSIVPALRSFWPAVASARDVAMAVASMALSEPGLRQYATTLLDHAAAETRRDPELLALLAQLSDAAGNGERAVRLYEQALQLDPLHASAANLAVHRMRAGHAREALALWESVCLRYPSLVEPGINLALAQIATGDRVAARSTLLRLLRFHPDLRIAHRLIAQLRTDLK